MQTIMRHLFKYLIILGIVGSTFSMGINLLAVNSMEPVSVNYCNNSELLEQAGLIKSGMGQFLGYECSQDFFHCRWQSDGFRTYKKECKTGLVYDVLGTQNCNYDYNVKTCGMRGTGPQKCEGSDFHCPLSGKCVPLSKRCDGHYDCQLEEDEQNCPLCTAGEFACIISEQCIPLDRRCNGIRECNDETDELDCDVCGHGLFHCPKSGQCIPIDERCDGRRQCPHGEDEMLCKRPSPDSKFTCQSRDYQIPMTQVCDGNPQCPDGSDEAYCEAIRPQSSMPGSFSSNPNPSLIAALPVSSTSAPIPRPQTVYPAPTQEKEEEDYEYDEHSEDVGPSFPMLSLSTPAPTIRYTTVTSRPSTRPKKPMGKIMTPMEKVDNKDKSEKHVPNHFIIQPVQISVTAPPAKQNLPSVNPVSMSSAQIQKNIPVKTVVTTSPIEESYVYSKPSISRNSNRVPQTTTEHSVVIEVTSPPVQANISKENILQSLGDQLNSGMSPELLEKIEKLLREAGHNSGKRQRPITNGRDAGLSPSAIIRTFSSRIQKQSN